MNTSRRHTVYIQIAMTLEQAWTIAVKSNEESPLTIVTPSLKAKRKPSSIFTESHMTVMVTPSVVPFGLEAVLGVKNKKIYVTNQSYQLLKIALNNSHFKITKQS